LLCLSFFEELNVAYGVGGHDAADRSTAGRMMSPLTLSGNRKTFPLITIIHLAR
jgi:hypothetical protein